MSRKTSSITYTYVIIIVGIIAAFLYYMLHYEKLGKPLEPVTRLVIVTALILAYTFMQLLASHLRKSRRTLPDSAEV